jgi:hypothetical protein
MDTLAIKWPPFSGQGAGCPGLNDRGTGTWRLSVCLPKLFCHECPGWEGGFSFLSFVLIRSLFYKECGLFVVNVWFGVWEI